MDSYHELPELKVSEKLQSLIKACEKGCDAECCGICAFNFTAVHVASFLSTYTGAVRDSDVAEWNAEIDKMESSFNDLATVGDGLVCVIPSIQQSFTAEAVTALILELRASVAASKEVFELSERLSPPVKAYEIMNEFFRDRRSTH